MLSLIVNNESIKKSYNKSQRIIAKYLPQVGRTTFAGSISQEGAEDLYKELKMASSRYISISCMQMKDKHTSELLWIIGNKDNFDPETGVYAMRTRSKIKETLRAYSDKEKYFSSLIKVAALLHDIGKSNQDFQNKLINVIEEKRGNNKSKRQYELFRHDIVSAIIWHRVIIKIEDDNYNLFDNKESKLNKYFSDVHSEISLIISQSSYTNIESIFIQDIQQIYYKIDLLGRINQPVKKSLFNKTTVDEVKKYYTQELTLTSILWLVLTHHRLIGVKHETDESINNYNVYNFNKDNQLYCNLSDNINFTEKDNLEKIRTNFTFNHNLPYQNKSWEQQLNNSLSECLFQNNFKNEWLTSLDDKISFLSLLTHYCRPFLIISDYLASVVKNKKDEALKYNNYIKNNNVVPINFANLDSDDFGDTLDSHLISVKNSSRLFTNLRHETISNATEFFSHLHNYQTKKLNSEIESKIINKFSWQNEAFNFIKKNSKNTNAGFCVVISETGSGKTIGGAKIMKALQKDEMRYTLALGLRTLTLQSGESYRKSLGLTNKEIAVVIGSEINKKLFNINQKITGSDTVDNDDSQYVINYNSDADSSWKEKLSTKHDLHSVNGLFENNYHKLIDAPIVVCTIDQIINITNLNKPSKIKLLPRIFSSDLLLDEIDSYSPPDLVHVGKLIYLYGLYGRKVTIMSATVSPIIIEELFNAYQKGIATFNYLNDKDLKINLFLISNLIKPYFSIIDKDKNINRITKDFIDDFIIQQNKTPSKNKLNNIIPIDYDDWKDPIHKESISLHNKWKTPFIIDGNTYNVSVGFIKFNSVAQAREYAHYLFTAPKENLNLSDTFALSCLCYHSKFSPIELNNIEQELNKLVNRKDDESPDLINKLKELINKNFNNKNKTNDLMIVISTTSILEVGRDHDYDWNILEPTSNKSFIQTAGRVLRHRGNECAESRISVLNKMIKPSFLNKASNVWKNSGVYNYLSPDYSVEHKIGYSDMFEDVYQDNIYSGAIFQSNINTMKNLEDKSYQLFFTSDNAYSLKKYLSGFWLNNSLYSKKFRYFEKKSSPVPLGFCTNSFDRNKINLFDFENYISLDNNQLIKRDDLDYNMERVFLNHFEIKSYLKESLSNFTDFEIFMLCNYDLDVYNKDKAIEDNTSYHPLLGFNYKKIKID